jgi:sugar O-acyltransferase (sialic acid O-acetyltransferase NeuD family)
MTAPLFIIGAGCFGREVFCIIVALQKAGKMTHTVDFIDDDPSAADVEHLKDLGCVIVGSIAYLLERTEPFRAVVAIASAADREMVAGLLADSPVTFPVLVHPDASIGCRLHLSQGVVVAAGSRLSTNISIGRHVHIDQNSAVGHDCKLDDFSRLNPQACVSGSVTIGRRVLVGANAIVLQGLTVGSDAIVGAGAVVTHPIAAATTVMGVPAR